MSYLGPSLSIAATLWLGSGGANVRSALGDQLNHALLDRLRMQESRRNQLFNDEVIRFERGGEPL
jgi:hypothetical protein